MMNLEDKNGVRIHVGDVIKIENGYFKSDNGLFMVTHEPNDGVWCGNDLSLHKVTKSFKPCKGKYTTAFYPLFVATNSYLKRVEAKAHNAKYVTTEIVGKVSKELVAEFA